MGEEDHRGKVLFSLHHIKDTYCHHGFLLLPLTRITWLSHVCQVSLPSNDSFPLPFPYRPLWKEVTMYGPHLEEWRRFKVFSLVYVCSNAPSHISGAPPSLPVFCNVRDLVGCAFQLVLWFYNPYHQTQVLVFSCLCPMTTI